jgi:hypothetical protein
MKTYYLKSFPLFCLIASLSCLSITRIKTPPAPIPYKVCRWSGADIRIGKTPIRRDLVFISASQIRFRSSGQWVLAYYTEGGLRKGRLFTNRCIFNRCWVVLSNVSINDLKECR